MEVDIVTKEDLRRLKEELIAEIKLIVSHSGTQKQKWLKSPDVRKMMGISSGTLQKLRINGILSFSKVGGTIYYRVSDIENVLINNSTSKK